MSAEATNERPSRRRLGPRIDLRRLGRAALGGSGARGRLPDALEHVAKAHRAHHPGADLDILRRAYLFAESSHRGQTRKSGGPFITHPLAVTLILAELGAETTTLTASLLHDTVEDTEVTLDQVGERFGAEVRFLVDGVTKLEKVDYGAAAEPETFRKMLVATGNDVRVMSIKLADRLHNMRTLGVMRPEKQARIAKVTRDVLIPLAERLGVQVLKAELEDLVFAILHPEEYAATREAVLAHAGRPDPLQATAARVRAVLREAGVTAEVQVRPRHFVSVHRVLLKRGEVTASDLGRLLVLVGEDADCYAVLGELHTCFTPYISEFKDFIAAPKFNLYQSLHTAVAGEAGQVAEVLIRTHQMHRVAEAGVIALGNPYAAAEAPDAAEGERADPTRPGWLSRLLEWQRSAPDPDTFWTSLRDELAQDREITVFRADGGTIGLPAGSSCVDAAYAQYGQGGHTCIGARVNGRLVALGTVLRDGDTLQLLMSPDTASGPSPDWREHARTPAARIAIGRWFATHPAPDPAADHGPAGPVGPALSLPPAARPGVRGPAPAAREPVVVGCAEAGLADASVRLAGCCTPVPPDEVTGFAVRGGAVTVHRAECPAVARMTAAGRRRIAVRWRRPDGSGPGDFRVTLRAESFSRPHLLADLTEAIAAEGVAVISAAVEPPHEQRVRHTYTLQLPDASHLPELMRAMRRVPGVYDVGRAGRPAAAPL
ncbi:bifunctional (p)ppGpp synthetase/guanosine-3',5'-bis(diphosphate) 3'-pyrophosphohydrolase [Streptomyces mobaraensis NBRC 13819 = DSM 40847]|uniref:(P)ppGpp synthetase I SpoT/RelA n=1 Tax=Streptomyces mobaraensis (strain ATCC 29032 / DSM 40847 / JCM 4168 / NBRC 13819 / NCIMB 11159 / IPCR 16-22) TaxID=1223523 RepID=M3C720_STRM1|nr:HD domain-containing protein [Streptomyces mobaraensis]EME99736.1 (p)ppGpp synthetase I SpoT/RelA [Streptomyces mobaraensis NBRC 13819 = DSM 40847]QTT76072.1 bifunctional (p)ppGpp synthetase/guanosine-3',5'-bis(diphosphate) 3'-pyrophosphohydrolase [Streptomyces mobaraensis NBRC 13819 = DSM 40847]